MFTCAQQTRTRLKTELTYLVNSGEILEEVVDVVDDVGVVRDYHQIVDVPFARVGLHPLADPHGDALWAH